MTAPRVIGVRRIGLFLLLLVAASVSAQSVSIARWPDGSLALNSGWCIHAGDHPAFAEPGFDDSHWQPVELRADPSVSDGGVEATSRSGELFGFARTQVISTQSAQAIADAARDFGQEHITVLTLNFAGAFHA
jgi:hypothetical protein